MIDTVRPDPDIPAALKTFGDKHGLKPKNIQQLLEASEEVDMDALARSPFLEKYLGTRSSIEAKPTARMLQGEALHLAALIELRIEKQRIPDAVSDTRVDARQVLQGASTGE